MFHGVVSGRLGDIRETEHTAGVLRLWSWVLYVSDPVIAAHESVAFSLVSVLRSIRYISSSTFRSLRPLLSQQELSVPEAHAVA